MWLEEKNRTDMQRQNVDVMIGISSAKVLTSERVSLNLTIPILIRIN